MQTRLRILAAVVLLAVWCSPFPVAHAQAKPGGAVTKLGRGVINIVTGWVEIPKQIYETSQTQGAASGWTWGFLRGIGHGFIRTAAGLYELVTFPFPAPPDYAPVMQPEYVFVDDGTPTATSSDDYKHR